MIDNVLVFFICAALLVLLAYSVLIWWVLWRGGWRRYLKIRTARLGGAVEIMTALLSGIGMLFVIPWPVFWISGLVEPLDFSFAIRLSSPVKKSLPKLVNKITEDIRTFFKA